MLEVSAFSYFDHQISRSKMGLVEMAQNFNLQGQSHDSPTHLGTICLDFNVTHITSIPLTFSEQVVCLVLRQGFSVKPSCSRTHCIPGLPLPPECWN